MTTVEPAPSSTPSLNERATRIAVSWIRAGRRLEMQGLSDALGISRVTLFRNVGNREELLGIALERLTELTQATAVRRWEAERTDGELRSIGVGHHLNLLVARSKAIRGLLDDEPALTLRLLTDPRGRVQTSVVAFTEALLRHDIEESDFRPSIDVSDLAYALVRLGESFLYADVLAARTVDVATADRLQRALIEGSRT